MHDDGCRIFSLSIITLNTDAPWCKLHSLIATKAGWDTGLWLQMDDAEQPSGIRKGPSSLLHLMVGTSSTSPELAFRKGLPCLAEKHVVAE